MAYASGGTIAATDYNSLATTLNTVLTAYGQTAVTTALTTGTIVTAAQWSTLIGALNNTLAHQSGAAAIALPVAGNTVTYLASVASGVTTANTNKLLATTTGTTITGANFVASPANPDTQGAFSATIATRTVTFSSAAAASYFFTAGGKLNFVISSVTGSGTAAANDIITLLGTNLGGVSGFDYNTNNGRTGSGGTLNTNNTALGYTTSSTTLQNIAMVTSATAAYTTNTAAIGISVNGATITFNIGLSQAAHTFSSSWSNVVNHRIDIVPPETTRLINSWGSPTVA